MAWYLFRKNDDQEWTLVRKNFDSKKEAVDYACNHNYQYSMISNTKELYRKGEYFDGARQSSSGQK